MRTIILALLMAFTMQVGAVQAASFDCAKAATETEKAICSDAILSIDDRVLSYIFQRRLALRAEGKVWNEERQRWSDTTSKILTENDLLPNRKHG